MIEVFQQITAMHSRVREFVEHAYPKFKVTTIKGYATTFYASPLHALGETPDFILTGVIVRFRIEASDVMGAVCHIPDVFVTDDGYRIDLT